MTIGNICMIFSVLVLFLLAAIFLSGRRFKKDKKLSPLAGLALACIVAGIFFANRPVIGFSLLAVGVILAIGDIIAKARSNRARKESQAPFFS
jgi:hypothetical protein